MLRLIHTSHKLNCLYLKVGVNHIQCISSSSGLICIIAIELCGNDICSVYSRISHSTILCNTYALTLGSYFVCYFKIFGVYKFCSIESTLSNVCGIAILSKLDACILTIVNHIQCISHSSRLISIIASEFCGNGICCFYSGISDSTILCNTYALTFGSYFVCYFKTIGVYKFGFIESTLSNVCSIANLGKMDASILTIVLYLLLVNLNSFLN